MQVSRIARSNDGDQWEQAGDGSHYRHSAGVRGFERILPHATMQQHRRFGSQRGEEQYPAFPHPSHPNRAQAPQDRSQPPLASGTFGNMAARALGAASSTAGAAAPPSWPNRPHQEPLGDRGGLRQVPTVEVGGVAMAVIGNIQFPIRPEKQV